MNYKNKYIKYKLKYFNLKNQIGGHYNKYSVYLVPGDYNGPSNSYFKKWGGIVPHCTLVSFGHYNNIPLKNTIKNAAKGSNNKRWILGNSTNRKFNLTKEGKLHILYFESNTLKNLKLNGLDKKKNLHFTLGENLDDNKIKQIIDSLLKCKDWKLILVKEDKNTKSISWENYYNLYD